jgi:hypothetical protein
MAGMGGKLPLDSWGNLDRVLTWPPPWLAFAIHQSAPKPFQGTEAISAQPHRTQPRL